MSLLLRRYEQLVTAFSNLYMTHPDAEVYSPEYRLVLARCMASKTAYGVIYEDDVERILKRFNQWHALVTKEESQGLVSD